MGEKVIISATVEKSTKEQVKFFAEKEKRTFSNMVDFFLQAAISKMGKQSTKNHEK